MFSNDTEYSHTLRWVALLSGKLKCDIAASTGIHNHETVIKQLLAGADAVHMVSVFYKNHFDVLPADYKRIGEMDDISIISTPYQILKGLLSRKNIHNPAAYERVQFLRLFSSVE